MAGDPFADPASLPERPGPSFPASYQSSCAGCCMIIFEGDDIRMFHGEAYHDDDECLDLGDLDDDDDVIRDAYEDATWD